MSIAIAFAPSNSRSRWRSRKASLPLWTRKPFPHAVAEHEAAVEHRHDGFGARLQFAVDVDQDRRVPRVGDVVHRLVICSVRPWHPRVVAPVHEAVAPARRVDVLGPLRRVPPDEADDLAHMLIIGPCVSSSFFLLRMVDNPPAARVAHAFPSLSVRAPSSPLSCSLQCSSHCLDLGGAHVHRAGENPHRRSFAAWSSFDHHPSIASSLFGRALHRPDEQAPHLGPALARFLLDSAHRSARPRPARMSLSKSTFIITVTWSGEEWTVST